MSEPTSRRDFLVGTAGVTVLAATGCGGAEPTGVNAEPEGDPLNFPASDRQATLPEQGVDAAACAAGTTGYLSGLAASAIGLNQAKKCTPPQGQPAPKLGTKALRLYVVRDEQGLVGLDLTCTHAGCEPAFVNQQATWLCPCHSSQYTLTGAVINGPALLPLLRFAACKGSDGMIHIDISKALP